MMKNVFTKQSTALALSASLLTGVAQAGIDLSPWTNPAGPNLGVGPDITLGGPVQDGVPVNVGVTIYNYGNAAIDTSLQSIGVRLEGNAANITTDADATNDTKTINDGTVIPANGSANVSWTWTPFAANGTTQLRVFVDPSNTVIEDNNGNNFAFRDVSFTNPPSASQYDCAGFGQPLDPVDTLTISKKSKRVIPVKTTLTDEYGAIITGSDVAAAPVINVTFNSSSSGDVPVDDSLLANGAGDDGNQLRYDETDATWIYNLSTKGMSASGTYTIGITSGDSDEYTLNPATCSINFARK